MATSTPIRIGTRGSRLARWQAEWVAEALRRVAPEWTVTLVELKTTGDRFQQASLPSLGTQGVFTKEIQEALLAGAVDVAVHSMKDLPTETVPGLALAAVPARGPVHDVLIAPVHRTLARLPHGGRVATSSLRRRAQLHHLRPDLRLDDIRGNVDSRLRKLRDGELDALVLAAAGLYRLGLEGQITEELGADVMLPAVGQGALAIEVREEESEVRRLVGGLDDAATRQAVTAERALLRRLEGGCQVPIGALGEVAEGALTLRAAVYSTEGRERLVGERAGSAERAAEVGVGLAEELLQRGAGALVRPRSSMA